MNSKFITSCYASKGFILIEITNSRYWAQDTQCYEQLRVVDEMSSFELWAQGSRFYKQLKDVDDMNNSRSWA